MPAVGYRKSKVFFTVFGICLVILAIVLNVSWIVLNWRAGVLFVLGILFFIAIIAGLVLNTIFLIREIRRNEQHDHFINAVTHELKTPIASIRLYLETLQRRDVDEAKRREFYQIMLDDSDRLIYTIEQVLRVGRSGRWHARLNKSQIDLAQLASECVDLARKRYRLAADAIQMGVSLSPDDSPIVQADADEIRAAVTNLLDNAVKYSGANVRVRVELVRTSPKKLSIRVSDSGIGIPSDQLGQIFKRFYRIPGAVAVRVKGTGLGLFIVRSIAEKHGGRAFAESEGAGKGSTFTIQLPTPNPQ